ncbi:MAG: glycosyltransferase family 2 protein [Bacteroidales bacterium]|nr:glycosyltransferase family 2 protein [Bacteroidales bacterium]
MDVSIIIVNYNTCNMTLECIDSIFERTSGVEFEVIVVDNASKDDSASLLAADRRIKFIEAGENIGFGMANNLALKSARGEYVLLLNSDTLLLGNAVFEMWDYMKKSKLEIGALGTVLLDKDGNDSFSSAYFHNPWKILWMVFSQHCAHLVGKKLPYQMPSITYDVVPEEGFFDVDFVAGADLMARKDTFEKYGEFDPEFFLYYEETELQFRWKKAGLRNIIIPIRHICHLEGGTTGSPQSDWRKKIQYLSERIYFRKTLPRWSYLIYASLHAILYLPLTLRTKRTK